MGIVWNYFTFVPKTTGFAPFYCKWVATLLNRLWGNDVFMRYLQTGEFDWNPLPW